MAMNAQTESRDAIPAGEEQRPYGEPLAQRVAKALISVGDLTGFDRKDLVAAGNQQQYCGLGLKWTARKMLEIPMDPEMRSGWELKVTSGTPPKKPPVMGCCVAKPKVVEEEQGKALHVVVASAPDAWGPKGVWKGKMLPCAELGDAFFSHEELLDKVADLNRELNDFGERVAFPADIGGFVIAGCTDGHVQDEAVLRWETEEEFVAWLAKQCDESMSGRDPQSDIVKLNASGGRIELGNQAITRDALEEYATERERALAEAASSAPKCGGCTVQ